MHPELEKSEREKINPHKIAQPGGAELFLTYHGVSFQTGTAPST